MILQLLRFCVFCFHVYITSVMRKKSKYVTAFKLQGGEIGLSTEHCIFLLCRQLLNTYCVPMITSVACNHLWNEAPPWACHSIQPHMAFSVHVEGMGTSTYEAGPLQPALHRQTYSVSSVGAGATAWVPVPPVPLWANDIITLSLSLILCKTRMSTYLPGLSG